jgi:diguanylate cyclase (GGDEF)-like protein
LITKTGQSGNTVIGVSLHRWLASVLLFLFAVSCSAAEPATRLLEGEWKFQAGDDMAWAESRYDDGGWSRALIPGVWKDGGYPETGQLAWYRKTIDVSDYTRDDRQLAVQMGGVRNAFELYADGVLLGGAGSLPPNPEINFDLVRILPVPHRLMADGQLVLALRVWGGDELAVVAAGAGPYDAEPRMGAPGDLTRELMLRDLPALASAVVFAVAGVWFLYFHSRVPRLRSYRWFAISGLLLAPYLLTLTQLKQSLGLSFPVLEKIESISFFLVIVVLADFFYAAMDRRVDWWMRVWQVYFLSLVALLLFTPGLEIHYQLRPFWQYGSLIIPVPFLIVIAIEIRRGNQSARILAVGALMFTVLAFSDLLLTQGQRVGPSLVPIGALCVLASLGVLLVNRFSALLYGLESEVADQTLELRQVNQRLQDANRSLKSSALLDPLTRLLNRRGFEEAVNEEHARIGRGGARYGLLLLDVDHFKRFNDQYGHACGDAVLEAMAKALSEGSREVDRRARWGGEEFVVLLPGSSSEGVTRAAEKLRAAVETVRVEFEGEELGITVSIGAALLEEEETFVACVARADHALYAAKSDGRNRVVLAA